MPEAESSSWLPLRAGQRLRGLLPHSVVTLIAVDELAPDLYEIYYRQENGTFGDRIITARELDNCTIMSEQDSAPAFDADANDFRLAAEALRLKYAALYDPMAAVNSSDVDPLPHQIRAVYQELLPRIPLRFLLADDPGAGKTIMAGLYLKELLLRSNLESAIVVAPGGLVEQWREELSQKFDLHFEILDNQLIDNTEDSNPFDTHRFLIARMDQVARRDDLMELLADVEWDVAIVDEAHRMSAHYVSDAGEIQETKRFKLGKLLSATAQNFLLMTATPHAGKEDDFQLFMSLLDRDRFEGRYRSGVHRTDTRGLMRRMVKEDLLTFEGRPLFPERHAYTVTYDLSDLEYQLYELVTDYVRTEMGRAERIAQRGDRRRGNSVGFALTMLQRRLASSPEAILRSLERRKARLEVKLRDAERSSHASSEILRLDGRSLDHLAPEIRQVEDLDYFDEELTDEERAEIEARVDEVMDMATAAETVPELRTEIAVLNELITVAQRVRWADTDEKWVQLRNILDEQLLVHERDGKPRKIIIFTEHRDTLEYLQQKISAQFGRSEAVATIHGGTPRLERKRIREAFTNDPQLVVLLATDAAGEGLNLQRAHLMVNYDLPWNPNRIEQRFGRIHRIGQREVCHLWNLVARNTREGEVFERLLLKIAQMSAAYNGNLFNVLGDSSAFHDQSLRQLLIEAIRYGDQPEVRQRLDQIIDEGVSKGLDDLMEERALYADITTSLDLETIRKQMELARERRLQPGYIAAFFISAFSRLGGQIRRRESGRYEITNVPARVIEAARRINRFAPLSTRYERVTFDLKRIHEDESPRATLIAPGHALLDAVIEPTIDDLEVALSAGTVLVDRRSDQIPSPLLMYVVEQRIEDTAPHPNTVSHHFDYVLLDQSGNVTVSSTPPYLDFDKPTTAEREAIARIQGSSWVSRNHEREIRQHVYRDAVQPRLNELSARRRAENSRIAQQVEARLLAEINYWDSEYYRLSALEREGTVGRLRSETALNRSKNLELRLDQRLRELAEADRLAPTSPRIRSVALIVPSHTLEEVSEDSQTFARKTTEVERRAVDAVMQIERECGRNPEEMPHNNPGYDIRSFDPQGRVRYIEVKGRIAGSETFTVTTNEVIFAQTQAERHYLALVEVSPDSPELDDVRYVQSAFEHIEPATTTRSYNELWRDYWERGFPPRQFHTTSAHTQ